MDTGAAARRDGGTSDLERRSRRELGRLALLFVALSIAIVLFKRHDLLPWPGACSAGGYVDDQYLAYCNSVRYGDYEHYAFLHATEPGQIEAVRDADVLFLGNSRAQFAFSTDAVERAMTALGIPFFVFGFGLGGTSDVPLAVMRRHDIDARALVINADPFFSRVVNPTFERVLAGGVLVDWEHRVKRLEQTLQRRVCGGADAPRWVDALLCAGDEVTIYRTPDTGRWDTRWFEAPASYPVTWAERPRPDRERRLARAAAIAEEFIAESGAERSCVVLTVVPHEDTRESFALELALLLGVRWSSPDVERLTTFDHSHLTGESARRWSAALMDDIAPVLERCAA